MKRIILAISLIVFLFGSQAIAQTEHKLNSLNNNKTINVPCGSSTKYYISDDAGMGTAVINNHGVGYDYYYTICSERPTSATVKPEQISIKFEEFNMALNSYMQIYYGRSITDPDKQLNLGINYDFHGNTIKGYTFTSPFYDTTGCLTIRVNTVNSLSNSGVEAVPGFKGLIECTKRCRYPVASLDTFFYKYDKDGNFITRPVGQGVDTIWNPQMTAFQLQEYKAVDICPGDSVIFVAKPIFPDNEIVGGVPVQKPTTCIYNWRFGDDSPVYPVDYDPQAGHKYEMVNGYELQLVITDTNNGGCSSKNSLDTRVRISRDPIKTVAPLPDMCSGKTFMLKVGYGAGSSVIVDSIKNENEFRKQVDSIVFIPDGPYCNLGEGSACYDSKVFFDQFRSGMTIQSVNDIAAVCVEMEHSFLGDFEMLIECPNGNTTVLKSPTTEEAYQQNFLGVPYGGVDHSDPMYDSYTPCAYPPNIPGKGFFYCFSNLRTKNQRGLLNQCPTISVLEPMVMANTPCTTCDSTNRADSSGYYRPGAGSTIGNFSSLIGCPMNGDWTLSVCDWSGIDNGFVFSWYMELAINDSVMWNYQVPIDTVIWTGPFMKPYSNVESILAPPIEECGKYHYDIRIIDGFACVWDTVTTMDVVCSPVVNLGPDTAICEQMSVELDAGNPLPFGTTTYRWEPGGEDTQKIIAQTLPNSNSIIKYTASVANFNGKTYCYGEDSINLIVHPAAMASFSMDKFPLEGCEPFEFQLISTSTNATKYEWTIGNYRKFDQNPVFTLPYGTYDLKLKVYSEHGCVDSIPQEDIIHVYKSPVADFGWLPNNPSVTYPTANFVNLTTPKDPSNQYHWSIQAYDGSPELRENVFGFEPSYTWKPLPGTPVYGDYYVTLDAYSVNNAPSGFVYECHDTISKRITIINDLLLFPTVVTPNGDGVNDIFYIKNLIEGQAFPDNELAIYNRLGRRVFFKQDIRNKEDFWDPALTNSPTGTYFYRFIGRGSIRDVELKGAVELLK